MSYKDDYERLNRLDYLNKIIPILQKEKANLESHFNNKKKVNNIVGYKERNGCKPLLGLYNKVIYHPSAYCELKQCYLLYDDMRKKSCYNKECRYLIILGENQKKKGLKNRPMKFYDASCDTL